MCLSTSWAQKTTLGDFAGRSTEASNQPPETKEFGTTVDCYHI
jgi:hypothetical protein